VGNQVFTRRAFASLGVEGRHSRDIRRQLPECRSVRVQVLATSFGGSGVEQQRGVADALARAGTRVRQVLKGHRGHITFLSWSPDNIRLLTCGGDLVILLWDTICGRNLREFRHHYEAPVVVWQPCGTKFLSGSTDGLLNLWHVGEEECGEDPATTWRGERVRRNTRGWQ